MRDHLRTPAAAAAAILTITVAIVVVVVAACSSDESPDSPTLTATSTATTAAPSQTLTDISPPEPAGYGLMHVFPEVGFSRMIDLDVIPGTDDREAVVVTQEGELWQISLTDAFAPRAYGDIVDLVNCCGELGLLSIAFSPDFTSDDLVYLYYSRSDAGDACSGSEERCSFVSRFTVAGGKMDPSPDVVLEIDQFAINHNGGKLLFDEQGLLYLGLGDGGGGFDTEDNGQDKSTLLGTVIRIDVSGPGAYAIPDDNPFVGRAGADEIWAYGLRNPWRMSFDRETGELWLADVGQGAWEEVNLIVKGGNYGWVCFEGNVPGDPEAPTCPPDGAVEFPRAVYANSGQDCAVVGGFVYRGAAMPELAGWYVFGDNCSGRIRAYDTSGSEPPIILIDGASSMFSMAELPNGEIVVLGSDNRIHQLVRE